MTGNPATTTNELDPFFKIVNNTSGSVAISQFKIRYWFTRDTLRPMAFGCAYAVIKCANISGTFTYLATPVANADVYAEVSFNAAAGSIVPNGDTGDMQLFLHNDIWSNFTQNNDYSFDGTKSAYAEWSKVTLYYNGALVWGTEPTGGSSTATSTPTFVPPTIGPTNTPSTATMPPATATSSPIPTTTFKLQYMTGNAANITNELDPFFQIVNTTSSSVPLSQFKIRYWFTRDSTRSMAFGCAYADVKCANISGTFTYLSTPVTNADVYAEVSFSATAGSIPAFGSSGQMQLFLHNDIWSNFTQSNDYSFDGTKSAYADWSKVTLYQNGTLIWGTEPH